MKTVSREIERVIEKGREPKRFSPTWQRATLGPIISSNEFLFDPGIKEIANEPRWCAIFPLPIFARLILLLLLRLSRRVKRPLCTEGFKAAGVYRSAREKRSVSEVEKSEAIGAARVSKVTFIQVKQGARFRSQLAHPSSMTPPDHSFFQSLVYLWLYDAFILGFCVRTSSPSVAFILSYSAIYLFRFLSVFLVWESVSETEARFRRLLLDVAREPEEFRRFQRIVVDETQYWNISGSQIRNTYTHAYGHIGNLNQLTLFERDSSLNCIE